jgi:hypothetical protein
MSSRRVLLVVLGVLVAAPLTASTALASPGWSTPVNYPMPASALYQAVGYQAGGTATVAYLEVLSAIPLRTALHVGVIPPGGSYQEQLTVASTASSGPVNVALAEAPDGTAVVEWEMLEGSNPTTSPLGYVASYRAAGSGSWGAPATIANDLTREAGISATLVPAISADDTAAAGVEHYDPTISSPGGYRIDVATHSPAGAWGSPVQISPPSDSSESLALGFDAHGDLTAAFRLRLGNGRFTLATKRRSASNGIWSSLEDVTGSDVTSDAWGPALGIAPDGSAVIAFQYVHYAGSKTLDVNAVTRSGNGSWSSPVDVAEGGASSGPMAAGVSTSDRAFVLYRFQGSSSAQDCVGIVAATVGASFTAPRCISATNFEAGSGGVTFLGGDAYFAWSGKPESGSEYVAEGSRWVAGSSSPDGFTDLDAPGSSIGFKQVLPDQDGSVAAFWSASSTLRAAAFDGGGPSLLGASVPASAVVGQPVAMSASPADLWSSLGGPPSWGFGDGSSASGSQVSHVYSTPGAYTVTLGAADSLGNATSGTYTVVVSAAAAGDAQSPVVTLNLPTCPKKLSKKACKHRRATRGAWRTLVGGITDPAPSSGIASVQVAVYRTSRKRVEALFGKHFRKTTKTRARNTFASARIQGARWSLHLTALRAGTYTIMVRATDRAGHVSVTLTKTVRLH